jgi:hypothetical protein
MLILQDPTRQRDPTSRHAFPDVVGEPKLTAPRTLAEEQLHAQTTPGGRRELHLTGPTPSMSFQQVRRTYHASLPARTKAFPKH